jgi:hypothetical protein
MKHDNQGKEHILSDKVIIIDDAVLKEGTKLLEETKEELKPENEGNYTFDIDEVTDCILLCEATYDENDAISFLRNKNHKRFSKIFQSKLEESEGHFLIAESSNTQNQTTYYLAVRGSTNGNDWARNFSAWTISNGFDGFVHSGWYARSTFLPCNFVITKLKEGHRVVITGHSLGGAVAQLATKAILEEFSSYFGDTGIEARLKCITFASPMPFTGRAADNISNFHKDTFCHFIDRNDIVPKILTWCQDILTHLLQLGGKWTEQLTSITSNIGKFFKSLCEGTTWTLVIETAKSFWSSVSLPLFKPVFDKLKQLLSYKPVGNFHLIDSPYEILSIERINDLMSYKSFILSCDTYFAHNMPGNYGLNLLRCFRPKITEPTSTVNLVQMELPSPIINEVRVHAKRKGRVTIQVTGKNLHCLHSIILPIVNPPIQKKISNHDYRNSEIWFDYQLSKGCRFLSCESFSIPLTMRNFFEEHEKVELVRHKLLHHPLEDLSFAKLLEKTLFLLFLSKSINSSDDNDASELYSNPIRKCLLDVLKSIPVYALFMPNNQDFLPFYLFNNPETITCIWNSSPTARNMLQNAFHARVTVSPAPPNSPSPITFALLMREKLEKVYQSAAWQHLQSLVETAKSTDFDTNNEATTFHHLEASIHDILDKSSTDSVRAFLESLEFPLDAIRVKQIEALEGKELFHGLNFTLMVLKRVAKSFGDYYERNPDLLGYWAWGRRWPIEIRNTSDGVRNIVAKHFQIHFELTDTLGNKEERIAAALMTSTEALHSGDDVRSFKHFVNHEIAKRYGYQIKCQDTENVARRIKLMTICSQLRWNLTQLPVVLIKGCSPLDFPTELLKEGEKGKEIDRAEFTFQSVLRTPIVRFCGLRGQCYGVLNTMPFSEFALNCPDVTRVWNETFAIFQKTASLTIVAIDATDGKKSTREEDELANITSGFNKGRTASNHPIMTCFVKQRKLAVDQQPLHMILRKEAQMLSAGHHPFDLSEICNDRYHPRVYVMFELPPDEPHGKEFSLISVNDIHKWILDICRDTSE